MNVRIFSRQWWVVASKGSKRAISIITVAGMLVMYAPVGFALVGIAHADTETLLFESFGSGSSVNDIPEWEEEGEESSATTRAQAADDNNDSASPDGERFAKIKKDEWICREINAAGYESLELSYYWRGDEDAQDELDFGVVEYSNDYDDCDDADWIDPLEEHDMTASEEWNTQPAFDLPEDLNDSTFLLRFRTAVEDGDVHFRVDGVEITGEAIESDEGGDGDSGGDGDLGDDSDDEGEPIELNGYKFYDSNRDSEWYTDGETETEPGIEGWTIYATPVTGEDGEEDAESGRVAKSTTTDESGGYGFEFLPAEAGWWRISEENRTAWTQTYPEDSYYDVYIEEYPADDCDEIGFCEDGYYNYNFGNWRWPVVEISKWNDVNRDGVRNEVAGTEELESPVADYPVAVGHVTNVNEGDEGHDIIETEIVALSLTGSNGIASIPLNPDWFGGFEGLDQALSQGLMAFEGQMSGWEKTYPVQTHDDEIQVSYREGLEQTPVFIDSFFDVFTEFASENPVMNQGWVHDQKSEPVQLIFGNGSLLIISGDLAESVGERSAVISWTTDRPGTSRVVYDTSSHPTLGDAPNYGYAFSTDTFDTDPKVTTHKVQLSPIEPNTTYYYRTISSASPDTVGNEGTFTTNPIGSPAASGGGGGGIPSLIGVVNGGGQVLGVATFVPGEEKIPVDNNNTIPSGVSNECFAGFLGKNYPNDQKQMRGLQQILLAEGFNVTVNGVFDDATFEAVKAFQLKYADEILAPWGTTQPTGTVYLTTRKKLNELYCGAAGQTFPLSDDEQKIIDGFKNGGRGGGMSGSTTGTIRMGALDTPTSDTLTDTNENASNTDQVGAAASGAGGDGFLGRIKSLFGF